MGTRAVNRLNGWWASLRVEPETLQISYSNPLVIPTVEELEEEVTSVWDEEGPDELDNQQDPDDIDVGESDAAYL
jgi:hypothetical protein